MKLKLEQNGYLRIGLSRDRQQKFHRVHRLVAFAFLDRNDEHTEVDHIDHNRGNNMVNNLRWVTASGNGRNRPRRADNTSGISGVYFDKSSNNWCANWSDENMISKTKYFSVKKYGDEEAKQLAINYRRDRARDNGYINV